MAWEREQMTATTKGLNTLEWEGGQETEDMNMHADMW